MKLFNLPSFIGQSIGLTQAFFILLFSFVVGILLSTIALNYQLNKQHELVFTLSQGILTSAESGATRAAWTLDGRLAQQVANNFGATHRR